MIWTVVVETVGAGVFLLGKTMNVVVLLAVGEVVVVVELVEVVVPPLVEPPGTPVRQKSQERIKFRKLV